MNSPTRTVRYYVAQIGIRDGVKSQSFVAGPFAHHHEAEQERQRLLALNGRHLVDTLHVAQVTFYDEVGA